MDYNTDRPIENCNQDLLGRASFSKQLGRVIYEYNRNEGLVIGLFGKWGTGKTSVINMAINELYNLAEDDEHKPIIMKFAPWNYSDKDNLISMFFQSLKNKLDLQDNEELKKKIGKALSDYSSALDALALVPVIGSGAATILKTLAKAQGANLMQEIDLDSTREKLEKILIETKQKIIIVIDDIDRLTNSQIRDIFQLVKQVADFPNVIYVLAMDREIVSSALAESHNINGNEYLEKIIQITFELPELKKSNVHNIFFSKLDEIIKELPYDITWDQEYWSNIFMNCINPYINTLRDVNRIINTFQFRYGMLYQETSFEDMVGLTTIEILEPELYKWICNNKDSVCGGFLHGIQSSSSNKVDYRKKYTDEFTKKGIDSEKAIKSLSAMFPIFAKDVNEYQFVFQQPSEIRSKMRVADQGRFDLYFMFDLDDIKVPRSTINACIYELNYDELRKFMLEVNNHGNIVYFIKEIRFLIDEIPYERIALIASAILSVQGKFWGGTSRAFFTLSAFGTAEFCIDDMLKKLKTDDERYEIIKNTIQKIDKYSLGTTAVIINCIELSYGRLAGTSEKKENQIISLDQLLELEELYVKRIQEITSSESILEINEFYMAFYLWESLDKEGVRKYISRIFENSFGKLRFICAMAGRWSGTKGSGWDFYSNRYSEYISDKEIYDLIQKYDKNKLDEFSELEQIKLASFVLNYQNDEMQHVNEQEATKLVKEWRKV